MKVTHQFRTKLQISNSVGKLSQNNSKENKRVISDAKLRSAKVRPGILLRGSHRNPLSFTQIHLFANFKGNQNKLSSKSAPETLDSQVIGGMPKVFPDQRAKFENDEFFVQLSRDSEVLYL